MPAKDKMRGQAILIIALLLFVIVALIALVVDGGNAYAQRRIAQNAVDTGVLAGIQAMVQEIGKDTPTLKERELWNIVTDYTARNGIEAADAQGWFIDINGERIRDIKPQGNNPVQKKYFDLDNEEKDVNGIEVEGDLSFDTYFARVIGFDAMIAHATAKAWVWCGVCEEELLFPAAVDATDLPTGTFTYPYTMTVWDPTKEAPGNFGWVYWKGYDSGGNPKEGEGDPDQSSSLQSLVANLVDTTRSGYWEVGDIVHGDPGSNFQPALDELARRIDPNHAQPLPNTVIIPLYSDFVDSGNNSTFKIVGFAFFELTCALSSKNHYVERTAGDCDVCREGLPDSGNQGNNVDTCIQGIFVKQTEDPYGEGVCATFDNVCTYKLRRPDQ